MELLEKGESVAAITALKTATELDPEQAEYFHKLGRAYFAIEDFDNVWKSYRRAAAKEPSNGEYANDFLQLWNLYDLQGTLNVGTPGPKIVAKLGQPDMAREARYKRIIYGFMAIDLKDDKLERVLDLRGLIEPMVEANEEVEWGFDLAPFAPNHHLISRASDHLEFVPVGQTVQDWQQMLSRQRFALFSANAELSPKQMMTTMKSRLQKRYPRTQWTVIFQAPGDILYHWRIEGDDSQPAQHEIARIVKGQRDYFRLAYVKKTPQLSDDELKLWTERLRGAQFVAAKPDDYDDPLYRRMAWELGHTLSMAALLKAQRGPDHDVRHYFDRAEKLGTGLNLPIPALLETTDNQIADLSATINFLLNTTGRPYQQHIKKFQGDAAAALFELAMKTNLFTVLYVPGDETSSAFVNAVTRIAQRARLPKQVTQPVIDAVESAAEREQVVQAIVEMQSKLPSLLAVGKDKIPQSKER